MNFINENPILRMASITICFIAGLVLVFTGWKMTGQMAGLIKMLVGVAFLLVSLKIYNIAFEDSKKNKR